MGLFGSILANKESKQAADTWGKAYRSLYGAYPSASEKQLFERAAFVIFNFVGTGHESVGASHLYDILDEYTALVKGNANRMNAFLSGLLGICCKSNGKPHFGYRWAADVITARLYGLA